MQVKGLYSFTGTPAATGNLNADGASLISFKISGLTSETIALTGSFDQANTIYSAAMKPIDLATGAVAASAALPNGSYVLTNVAFNNIKFTKSSTSETAVVTVCVVGQGY